MGSENFYETYVNDGGVHDRRLSYVLVFIIMSIFIVVSVGSVMESKKHHEEVLSSIMDLSGYDHHEIRYDELTSRETYFVYFENGESYRYWFDEVNNEVTREKIESYRL